MIRFLLFILFTALLVGVSVLLASDKGMLVFDWMQLRVELRTSLALVLLVAFLFAFWLVIRFVSGIGRLPGRFGQSLTERRVKRAALSLGEGLAAVRGGDTHYSAAMLKDAEKAFPDGTGVKLLGAEIAFAKGDFERAKDLFRDLTETVRFNAAGRRGLLEVAQAQGDEDETLVLAREAVNSGVAAPWATGPLFQILARRRQWEEALGVLGRSVRSMKVDDPNRPVRASLLAAMARDASARGSMPDALRLAQQALALDPGLTEATLIAARALIAEGKPRKAIPVLTGGWKRHPHPEIVKLYQSLEPGRDPLRRLQRIDSLIESNPTHPESRMALAETALGAKLWGQARHILDPLVRGKPEPSPAVCRLVALLEEGENQDMALANQWLMLGMSTKQTEGWYCVRCKAHHGRWEPVCPACGSLGTIVWDTLPGAEDRLRGSLPSPGDTKAEEPTGKARDQAGKAQDQTGKAA